MVFLAAATVESACVHVQVEGEGSQPRPLGCLQKTKDLGKAYIYTLLYKEIKCCVHVPGSTFVTQSSPVLVPFSTVGRELSTSGPPWSRAALVSFQLYICSLEPDEPASITIPKRREASHESMEVGGGIYTHRPAVKRGLKRRRGSCAASSTLWSWWSGLTGVAQPESVHSYAINLSSRMGACLHFTFAFVLDFLLHFSPHPSRSLINSLGIPYCFLYITPIPKRTGL